ncbi:lantibiotic dehydratase [Mucilaginibacter sp. CAU 1740]
MKMQKLSELYKFSSGLMLKFHAFNCDEALTSASVRKFIDDDLFMQALWLTSKDLHEAVLNIDAITDAKKREKLELTLAKFINRVNTGDMPAGLFGGYAPVSLGAETSLNLNETHQHTKLNPAAIYSICLGLLNDDAIRPLLSYHANKTLYTHNKEYRKIDGQTLQYAKCRTTSIAVSDDVKHIIEFCQVERPYCDLLEFITHTFGMKADGAAKRLNELIDSQVLWSELEPRFYANEYIDHAICVLNRIAPNTSSANTYLAGFDAIKQVLNCADSVITKNNKIAMILKNLIGEVSGGTFLQVDYFRQGATATLDEAYTDKLLNAIDMLNNITPKPKHSDLENFVKRFKQRYHEQEVPLMQVLDPETGIGYHSEKKDKQAQVNINGTSYPATVKWLISQVVNNPASEVIDLPKALVGHVDMDDEHELPPSFSVVFRVSDDEQPLIYLESCGKPTGNAIFNRLASAEKSFKQIVAEIAETEAYIYDPALVAEIVHSPSDSLGSFIPGTPRGYQAPLTDAQGNGKPEVYLNDLMVTVKNNEVVLRSVSLNRRVIPATTNAGNYGLNNLAVYRFLDDIKQQSAKQQLGINLDILPTLGVTKTPRIVYEGVILALKTWYINNTAITELQQAITGDYDKAWERFLNYWQLPDTFTYADADNELVVHTTSRLEVVAWLSSCKKKQQIVLKEYIGSSSNIILKKKEEKQIATQFVGVLKRGEKTPENRYATATPLSANIAKRQFFPGDEWLYVKLYCGLKTADQVIGNELIQLSKKLYHEDLIDQWFYVRHADPEPHIRFRVHLASVFALGRVIQSINNTFSELIKSKQIWKVQFDTYERELERYGEASIELVEQLFFNDSLAIASLLSRMDMTDNFDEARWLWGLLSIDRLLGDFELDTTQKIAVMELLAKSSHQEDADDNLLTRQLAFRYRHYRGRIESLFAVGGDVVGEDLLRFRSLNNRPAALLLSELISSNTVPQDLNLLLISLVQMSMNRLFKTKQRVHELFVYDFLLLYYQSTQQQQQEGNLVVNAQNQYFTDRPYLR